jgi:SAM-dependent methyltransferase
MTDSRTVMPPAQKHEGDALDPLTQFPWPHLPGSSETPQWNGRTFLHSGRETRFLSYTESTSAWSDELTAMHESEAACRHPIDIASRGLALDSMKTLPGQPVILDVGCASGFLLKDLCTSLPHAALIGADYLSSLLIRATSNAPNIPLLQFDLRTCPLGDETVDGVTALNVLEHIDDDETAVHQIYRILKRGGIAHLEVPSGPSCYDVYDEVLMHHRRYALSELRRLCENTGFAVEWANHLGFYFFPFFWVTKQTNRLRARSWSADQKRGIVARQIRKTARSQLMGSMFTLERMSGKSIHYPVGIRAVLRLRKT